MNDPRIFVPVGLAVLAIIAVCTVLVTAWAMGRRQGELASGMPDELSGGAPAGVGPRTEDDAGTGAPPVSNGVFAADELTIDRVIRIVSLLFIAAAGAVTAVSPGSDWSTAWAYLLLALATLFVVFAEDLLRERLPAGRRYALETACAIAFLGLLIACTGGVASPFVIGYFLLVGGAALAWQGAGPLSVAMASGLTFAFVGLVVAVGGPGGADAIEPGQVSWILFVLASLLLLAYVGTVAGRAQRRARDAALRLSRYDALTGLYNRGAFFAAVEREIKRAERSGRGFCLVMLDLDDLKPVNDTFGHPAGDQLLRAITTVVLRTVRATDLAGRYGGDEFVVLLPETDADGAFVVAEKLRRDIAVLAIRVQERVVRTSVSLGLVTYPDDGRTIDDLLSAADAAMYEAKRRGKNQIVGYTTRTERVATAIGPARAPATPARPRLRTEESRAEELGLPRPSGRETVESTWAPPSGQMEAVDDPGLPDPPAVPAAAPAPIPDAAAVPAAEPVPVPDSPAMPVAESALVPGDAGNPPEALPEPGDHAVPRGVFVPGPPWVTATAPASVLRPPVGLHDDPLDATAPAYPASQPGAVPGPSTAPAGPAIDRQAGPATAARATLPRLPSLPSLPAQPVRTGAVGVPVSAVARTAAPVQPRDPAAAGLPPVPTGDLPWTPRASGRGSNAPRGARAPADRQYVTYPVEEDQPR